jgi:hypothetical protein
MCRIKIVADKELMEETGKKNSCSVKDTAANMEIPAFRAPGLDKRNPTFIHNHVLRLTTNAVR